MNNTLNIDYAKVAKLPSFKNMQKSRMVFTVPITIFFMAFYLGLPILAGFTKVLTHKAIGPVSWAWIYAFAQFIMTWGLCMLYLFRANGFDAQNKQVLADIEKLGPADEPGEKEGMK